MTCTGFISVTLGEIDAEKEIRDRKKTIKARKEEIGRRQKRIRNLIDQIAETDNRQLRKSDEQKVAGFKDQIHRHGLANEKDIERIKKRQAMVAPQDQSLIEKIRNSKLREDMIFDEKKEVIKKPHGPGSIGFWPMGTGPLKECYDRDERIADYSRKRFPGYPICEGKLHLDGREILAKQAKHGMKTTDPSGLMKSRT